jgi:antitoxin HigA-1
MAFERRQSAGWAVHPGEILKEEFLKPMHLSGYALAKALGVTPQRVSDIVLKKTGVSADMAILLGRFLGTSPEFWMNLQTSYALAAAQKSLKAKASKIKPFVSRVA